MGGGSGKVSPEPQAAAGPGEERAGGAPGSWSGGMGIGGSSAEPVFSWVTSGRPCPCGAGGKSGVTWAAVREPPGVGLALSLWGAEVTETS